MFWLPRTSSRYALSSVLKCQRLQARPISRSFSTSRLRRNELAAKSVESPASVYEGTTFTSKVPKPRVLRHILLFVCGSAFLFTFTATLTTVKTERAKERLIESSNIGALRSVSSPDLRQFEQVQLVKVLREHLKTLKEWKEIPLLIRSQLVPLYVAVCQPYADAHEYRRTCWKIILMCGGIWMMWKIKSLQPFMERNFLHQPLSGRTRTLFTSTFSHSSLLHLAMNCFVLEGFGSAAGSFLARKQYQTSDQLESTTSPHLFAFIASAGMFSSLISHIASVKLIYPRLVAQLSSPSSALARRRPETWASAVQQSSSASVAASTAAAASAPPTLPGSLGISGAIYACATMIALANPNAQIALAIPPSFPINIQWGVGALVCMDVVGALRGWRFLDHWGHLGGAAFGVLYYHYGMSVWNHLRKESARASEMKREEGRG